MIKIKRYFLWFLIILSVYFVSMVVLFHIYMITNDVSEEICVEKELIATDSYSVEKDPVSVNKFENLPAVGAMVQFDQEVHDLVDPLDDPLDDISDAVEIEQEPLVELEVQPEDVEPVESVLTDEEIVGIDPDFSLDAVPELDATGIDFSDDFLSLCSVIHYEAGVAASLESKITVGRVVVNRLNDDKWDYDTLHDVIYAPSQFNVVNLSSFESFKSTVLAGNWSDDVQATVQAAQIVLNDSETCMIPADVQFFYGDPDKRTWGSHEYCFTVGGNSYFK